MGTCTDFFCRLKLFISDTIKFDFCFCGYLPIFQHSSTIYLWFLPDIKVMVEARNSHVQDGESDGDANLLSPE